MSQHKNHQAPATKTDETKTEAPKKVEAKTYTYVGAGAEPPRVINFMGMQKFVRGAAVEVTDARVLAKLAGNPSFVEGEVDQETLHLNDEEQAAIVEEKKAADAKLQASYHKKHKTE